jgi:hypothetical protein
MDDKDFERDDVKEYRPRKKKQTGDARFTDNYNVSPTASEALRKGARLGYDANDLDNGVMLSTSEIIDFSEGTDSWTGVH